MRAHADEAGEFLATAARVATEQTGNLHGRLASFEAGLAHCGGAEDAINLLIGGFSELTGAPRVTVQDLRDLWASVPGVFDQIDELAAGLRRRAATLGAAGGGPGSAGVDAAPPPEPPAGGPDVPLP
ncbi:MAG: hypothetical protein EPN43_13190 [Jatrophihabitans sp.]|nr:MAG: hypothetical protein EPN43_13190 [Jatrophihabitans sp.]